MIEQFEVGHWYRFIGDRSDIHSFSGSAYSGMADGIPRKCISNSWKRMSPCFLAANFEGIERDKEDPEFCWDFSGDGIFYEEVPAQEEVKESI